MSRISTDLADSITAMIVQAPEQERAVAVSVGTILDGEVVDLRHFGWEDVASRRRASEKTMYRWASVAKPLTAALALQLVKAGQLDLDRGVREYVPEFPKKKYVVTSDQLLSHLGGIVNYNRRSVVTTDREYTVEHPWGDRILCLDKFKASPLIAEPTTRDLWAAE